MIRLLALSVLVASFLSTSDGFVVGDFKPCEPDGQLCGAVVQQGGPPAPVGVCDSTAVICWQFDEASGPALDSAFATPGRFDMFTVGADPPSIPGKVGGARSTGVPPTNGVFEDDVLAGSPLMGYFNPPFTFEIVSQVNPYASIGTTTRQFLFYDATTPEYFQAYFDGFTSALKMNYSTPASGSVTLDVGNGAGALATWYLYAIRIEPDGSGTCTVDMVVFGGVVNHYTGKTCPVFTTLNSSKILFSSSDFPTTLLDYDTTALYPYARTNQELQDDACRVGLSTAICP